VATAHAATVAATTDPSLWPAAVSAWEKLDRPYELAQVLQRSRSQPERAMDIAVRLGATPLIVALSRTSPHGLTPREQDVLELLALGRSNREIAEELFISAKTASVHVSSILRKLGVSSRGEAIATARDLNLGGVR
jgi:DNA-binding NarL/FixJ family response regulator